MPQRLFAVALCFSAVTLCAPPAEAQNTNVGELSIVFWSPDPELTIQSGAVTNATELTDIDFVQEFGIEKKSFPEIRFVVGRSHKFRLGYVPVKYDASATIQRTITFRGQTFSVGVPASTEITWDVWRFGYEWDFVSTDRGFVGLIGELKYNRLQASINSAALASPAETDQKAPVPTVGMVGRGFVAPMVTITGEFTGLKITTSDFEATFADFDINGAVTFGPVGVQGGYRSVTVDYVIDEDSGDLKIQGPYVGFVVRF